MVLFLTDSLAIGDAAEAGEFAARVLESAFCVPPDVPHNPQENQQGQTVQEVSARLHDGSRGTVRGRSRGKG